MWWTGRQALAEYVGMMCEREDEEKEEEEEEWRRMEKKKKNGWGGGGGGGIVGGKGKVLFVREFKAEVADED